MTRPAGGIVETTAPLLHLTLRLRRVRLGLLRETLTAVADAELRARGVTKAPRRAALGHVRRFVRAFTDRAGLPGAAEVRGHLRGLRDVHGLPRSFVEGRAAAVAALYDGVAVRGGAGPVSGTGAGDGSDWDPGPDAGSGASDTKLHAI